jgi:hypothetical protein
MATYAMMSGNSVSNVIIADDKEATEAALNCVLIELTSDNPGGIGWTLGEDGKFHPPVEEEGPEGLTELPEIQMVNGPAGPTE